MELKFQVLQELERRRTLEEQVRWDFMALDRTGSYRISTKDALMLFRNTHGEDFSMKTWHAFLISRDNPQVSKYYLTNQLPLSKNDS